MNASVDVAVVTTPTVFGDGARERNLAIAREQTLRAADAGAQFVVFPESFPGPWRRPIDWTPVEEMTALAGEAGVHLVTGFAEPVDGSTDRAWNSLLLAGPDGTEIGRYRRTSPSHAPWVYRGGTHWDFDWVTSDDLPVFDTTFGPVGLLVCSEIYVPELARILALKGAELIVMPAGLTGPGRLFDTWRTLGFARAIENLAGTAICSNIAGPGRGGLAMICSPEEILVESTEPGIHHARVDLDRIRWLREQQDRSINSPVERPWRTKPGTLRDWRRPEVIESYGKK